MSCAENKSEAKAIKVTARHLLLVEGKDEELLFAALLKSEATDSASEWQVIALGKSSFRRRLKGIEVEIRSSSVESVGVVRDADEDAAGAFQSVCDALRGASFAPPASHAAIAGKDPRVGVFVMPDGQNRGALEALCRESVAAESAGLCTQEYLDCLSERNGWGDRTERNTAQRDKAFVHAYLASRRDPVARTGEGARQGVWDFGHEAFRPVTEFLLRLTEGSAGDGLPHE